MDSRPAEQMSRIGDDRAPVVTVVMANYNGSAFIEAALRSALRQSLQDIEIIVADDASTDDSAQRVAAVARRDPRVRLLRLSENGGAGAARNRCLQAARGRWIAILDSDDLMHPVRLERLVAAAERDGADIVADDLLVFDVNPRVPPETCLRGCAAASAFWVRPVDYVRANTLFSGGQSWGYLKPVIRSALIRDSGLHYDGRLRIAEDYDFILRLLLHGARFRVYPQPGYFYRKHGDSVSHRLSRHTLQPMLAAHEQLQQAIAGQDAGLDAAMAARRASLQRALAFDALVVALKRTAWHEALSLAIRRPRLVGMLRRAASDRLRRLCTSKATAMAGTRCQVRVLSRQRVIGNTNGSSVYLLGLCTALQRAGCDVHLIGPSPAAFGRWPAMLLRPEMRVFRTIRLRRSLRLGPLLLATDPATLCRTAVGLLGKLALRLGFVAQRLNQPAPYAIAQPWTRPDLLFIARHARQADVVIADYAFLADGIPYALCPEALGLVIMHDLFSSRSAQFTRLGTADSVTTIDRPTEMALLSNADVVVAIQAEEAQIVRDCLPRQQVIVAPLAIEPVEAPQPGSGRSVLFVGSNTAPNVIGLRWVFETIWPTIRGSVPNARLEVAGSVCGAMGDAPEGVRLLGPVRDLAALYRDAAVVISPLLAGSGLKIKLVEALGQGKAVVATGVTLQGLSDCPPDAVAVADTAPEFAAAVIELLRDEALRTARAHAGLALARARFSAPACYAALLDVVLAAGERGR